MRRDILTIGVLWAAMPFTHMLDLGYTFFSFEVWGMSAAFLAIGALLAFGAAKSGLHAVLAAASIFFLLCIYFIDTSGLPAFLVIALFTALYLLQLRQGATVSLMASTFAVIFSLSNVLVPKPDPFDRPPAQATAPGTPQNALVHIILDEQASLDTLAQGIPPDHPARTIYDDYTRRGFHLYRSVQAPHHHTNRSLPGLVSMGGKTHNIEPVDPHDDHIVTIKTNALLQQLTSEGYRVRVIQSSYLDFCAKVAEVDCRSYPIRDMSVFQTDEMSLKDRLQTAFLAISRDYMNPESGRYVGLYDLVVDRLFPPGKSYRYLSWPMRSLQAMDDLETELQGIRHGDVVFAHLLLPHFPFILDADCTPKSPAHWAYPLRQGRGQALEDIETAYWDQVACAHERVMRLMDAIAGKDYVSVIIHGDHGARLHNETDSETVSDNLDTYLAVKRPDGQGSDAANTRSLQKAFTAEFRTFIGATASPDYLN